VREIGNLFRSFVAEMDSLLKENELVNGKSQRALLNQLFKLENEFKKALLSSRSGEIVYEKFMRFILEDKGNKLSIRPYFRERQDTFSNRVFPILREIEKVDPKDLDAVIAAIKTASAKLHKFRINYFFVKWALASNVEGVPNYKGPNRAKMEQLYAQILESRKLLCENNLPLAINRAKLFWSKVPEGNLEYMDLIQDSSRGLLEAIDNFTPPYRTVFRTTAIGRMTLNMGEDNSATLVKLSPREKRILYRARKAKRTNADISGKELEAFVNESFKGVTAAEIEQILIAADQTVSMDYSPDGSRPMSETLEDPAAHMDKVERSELTSKLLVLLERLETVEKKVLMLKHGELHGIFPNES